MTDTTDDPTVRAVLRTLATAEGPLKTSLDKAVRLTRTILPSAPIPAGPCDHAPRIEVWRMFTHAAARRLQAEGETNIAVLNFADAVTPGGLFLEGALTQEEALCRTSGLYSCLTSPRARAYYEANKLEGTRLYTDAVIYSPAVPFFRSVGSMAGKVYGEFSILTCPAPYAKRLPAHREYGIRFAIRQTIERRARRLLCVARAFGHKTLVLGAWGCGAFGCDPTVVAEAFKDALKRAPFDRVVFAIAQTPGVPDANLQAFRAVFEDERATPGEREI